MARKGNGTSDSIQTSVDQSGPSTVSLHFWYQNAAVPGSTTDRVAFSMANPSTSYEFSFLWEHTNATFRKSMSFRESGGTYRTATLTSSPSANTWYAIGGSYDGTNLKVFLNGTNEATTAAAAPAAAADCRIAVFARGDLVAKDDGQAAECAMWNVALTADEFAALAKGVPPLLVRPSALFYYAPLINDAVNRNGPALTVSGTTVTAHPAIVGTAGALDTQWVSSIVLPTNIGGWNHIQEEEVLANEEEEHRQEDDLADLEISHLSPALLPTTTPSRPVTLVAWNQRAEQQSRLHEQLVAAILNSLLRRGDLVQSDIVDWVLGYAAGDAADWNGAAPTTLADAIDRIAQALATLGQRP